MRNYGVCIVNKDAYYKKAFASAVTLDHAGFSITARDACGQDCAGNVDVCIIFGEEAQTARGRCKKVLEPVCGPYAGVSAILHEAKVFVYDIAAQNKLFSLPPGGMSVLNNAAAKPVQDMLICVYACTGGSGTSCAAIGIGRELARYRGESVLYLSLEDAEDPGLFPHGLTAMSVFDIIYRYMRITDAAQDVFERLFHTATARDEYGLYRFAPDDGAGSLASLSPDDVYSFLICCASALGLTRIVLDFGTRLHAMMAFSEYIQEDEMVFIEVCPEHRDNGRKGKRFLSGMAPVTAVFPECGEDVRMRDDCIDVGLGNAFGLAVKEVCDRILGERPC